MAEFMKVEQVRNVVIGLRPVYSDIGDITEIITASGDIYRDSRKLRTVRKSLARSYGIDLAAQAEMIASEINKQAIMPFFIESQRVFIPLKMRIPVSANDSAYGYVDVRYIIKVDSIDDENHCLVRLSNELEIPVLNSQASVLSNQHVGQVLLLRNHQELDAEDEEERLLMESARIIVKTVKGIRLQLNKAEAIDS